VRRLVRLPLDDEDDLDARVVLFRRMADVGFIESGGGSLDLMSLNLIYVARILVQRVTELVGVNWQGAPRKTAVVLREILLKKQ